MNDLDALHVRAKALNLNREHDAAKKGFARVGGKSGQTYQTF